MSEQPLEHWPTERMIQEGHADYAVKGDLEGLDESILIDIAQLCEVNEFAPDECIPCLAHTIILDRRKQAAEAALPHPKEDEYPEPEPGSPADLSVPSFQRTTDLSGDEDPLPEREPAIQNISDVPVVERFAEQVESLHLLVEELLKGPPIPPREVTRDELALLAVAAQRWVNTTDAAGFDLSPKQQKVLDATKTLLARLHTDG